MAKTLTLWFLFRVNLFILRGTYKSIVVSGFIIKELSDN